MDPKLTSADEKARKVYAHTAQLVADLSVRWADEHKYENIEDYANVLKNSLNELKMDTSFTGIKKRPFGFSFEVDGFRYSIQRKGRKIEMYRIPVK